MDSASDEDADMVDREEQVLVEALIAHLPLKVVAERILGRLSRRAGAPVELLLLSKL